MPAELPVDPPVRRPDQALPAGRVGYDLRQPRLLCHTFVPRAAYDELRSRGELVCREDLVAESWPRAYAWMRRQLSARRHGGAAIPPPLWMWARTTRAHLVEEARVNAGSGPTVLLTCRLPQERVLLSGFLAWHDPLNDRPVLTTPDGRDDDQAWDDAFDAWDARMELVLPGHRELPVAEWPVHAWAEVERTWARVFDPAGWPRGAPTQGVVARILVSDVVDAVQVRPPLRAPRAPEPAGPAT